MVPAAQSQSNISDDSLLIHLIYPVANGDGQALLRTSLDDGFDNKSVSGDENADPNVEMREAISASKIKTLAPKERTHSDVETRMIEANRMKKRLKQ